MILSPCCCRCHDAPSDVDEWENVTRVFDYTVAALAAGIPPYARSNRLVNCGDGSCACAVDCGTPGTPDWQAACFDQSFDFTTPAYDEPLAGVIACTGGVPADYVVIGQNCYHKTGATVSFHDTCKKYGWKGVQSKAPWPGRFGFIQSGETCCTGSPPDSGGANTTNQSKFTTVRERSEVLLEISEVKTLSCAGNPDVTTETYYHAILDQTATVDSYGNVTRTGTVEVTKYVKINGSVVIGSTTPSGDVDDADGGGFSIPTKDATLSAVCNVVSFKPFSFVYLATASALTALAINAQNFSNVQGACDGTDLGAGFTDSIGGMTSGYEITLANDRVEADHEYTNVATHNRCCAFNSDDWQIVTTQHFHHNHYVELSGSLDYADVVTEAKDLLGQWPLNDDAVYPWRRDAKTWLMPMVWRHAAASVPTIDWAQDGSLDFISVIEWTGDIQGAPLPAGYGRHFNFVHKNWSAGASGVGCGACMDSLGATSPSELPPTATEWTEEPDGAAMLGPGAHLNGAVTDTFGAAAGAQNFSDYVVAQKWAETLEAWPSINFARACGRDRYLFDEEAVACIDSFAGSDLILEASPAVSFLVGDRVVCDDGGVYEVVATGVGGDPLHYTVGAKLYDSPLDCDGAAKLRFPSARPICSSLKVSCVQTSPGLITCTTPSAHWLKGGGTESDTVDFFDVGGLSTGVVATWASDTTFTVPGTLTSPASGTVRSPGVTAPEIAFDTTCSKHDFIYREWQGQFRENGEDGGVPPVVLTETQENIAPSPTNPTVLCISPNAGDTFPHGQTWSFGTIEADQCYGGQWSANFLQATPDPFWQADHLPCGHGPDWAMADQPCADLSGGDLYSYPPLVEPRLTTPSGAPTLPVTLHEEPSVPTYVGHPSCAIDPYARATVHYVREAWLACSDWKERIGHRC